ncbi:hypothetical protein SSP35_01_01640 [Streptomyces sp. NBRC 110611]|nr:hypothetical protein SSP35_01_01640 [Streptomyces sp. NBRC 110611]
MMVPPVIVPTTGPSRGAGASRSSDFFHMALSLRGGWCSAHGAGHGEHYGAGYGGGGPACGDGGVALRPVCRKGLRAEIAITALFIHTEPFWI